MLSNLKLYGSIAVLVVMVALGGAVKFLWDERAELQLQLAASREETEAAQRATLAVEAVAQKAAERAVSLQPTRVEVLSAPPGGCVGPAVRSALRGLHTQTGAPAP